MSDALLGYYMRELAYLREQGAEFARRYPKIAGRLRIGPDQADDPMVARLVESIAFLNARIRHKLDDDFPEIAEAMLNVLYPHYLKPVPSMAIVQCTVDPTQGGLTGSYTIPRGTTVESEPIDGEPCRFRTAYPLTLWPIELVHAELVGRPFKAAYRSPSNANWLLDLHLECTSPKLTFEGLAPGSLRFFLMGKAQYVFELYEALFVNVKDVAVAASLSDPGARSLGSACLRQVGFAVDEGMLPYSPRSFAGYRLLTEYFAFPSKFLFFDVDGLDARQLQGVGTSLHILFYLDRLPTGLPPSFVATKSFQLGCVPVVNLYRKRAEPARLTQTESEVRVIPDIRRPLASEVYSIDGVTASSPTGEAIEYLPFYELKPPRRTLDDRSYYYAARRTPPPSDVHRDPGTEVYLSLVDRELKPTAPASETLHVETTCLNRDLPSRLPFGVGRPRLQLGISTPVARVICLTPPTPTLRPPLSRAVLWPLISHLTLNHLSISDAEDGAEALRAILRLYDFADSSDTRKMIDGLISVTSQRVVGRTDVGGQAGIVRGTEVTIEFDEEQFTGHGLFILASVLERFLGLYCSINSFTTLVATTRQRDGELKRWPPRAGETILL
jgi:type VI secretion system protein ImpG